MSWFNPFSWFSGHAAEVPGAAPAPTSGALRVLTAGFNRVDPGFWGGWDGALGGCERDADDVAKACATAAEREILTATSIAPTDYLRKVRALATRCRPGDRVVLWFSGHGGNDLGGDPSEPKSEYLCFPRGPLPEWDLQEALRAFPSSVAVLLGIDACHSAGLAKAIGVTPARIDPPLGAKAAPISVLSWVSTNYAELFAAVRSARSSREEMIRAAGSDPDVLILAAARENEFAYDGRPNGAFTGATLDAWRRFPGARVGEIFTRGPAKLTKQHPQRDFFTAGGERVWNARAFA